MKTLTALIPFFNEERTLPELVGELNALPSGTVEKFIFVDDGSTDRSLEFLKIELEATGLSHLVISKNNGGKASAIKEGAKSLITSHVVILDSDLELKIVGHLKIMGNSSKR